MAIYNPSPRVTPKTKYIFIDGACLRSTITEIEQRYAPGQRLDLDYTQLTAGFDKVFYYDALPSKHASESEQAYDVRLQSMIQFHDKLGALDRFHVYEGDTRRSPSLRKQEQKKVDVMIMVDMLTHAFKRNMQECTLLAGDLDFKPLLDALVNDGMNVTLWFPPKKTSRELVAAADQRRQLDIQTIHYALRRRSKEMLALPNSIAEPSRGDIGSVLECWTVDGDDFRFVQVDEGFVIEGPNPNVGYKAYWSHPNSTFLRLFAEDVFGAPPKVV